MTITSPRERLIYWLIVFSLNLFIPALIGAMHSNLRAIVGIMLAIVVLAVISSAMVIRFPRLGTVWTWGGIFIAFMQFLPMLHLMIGSIAISSAQRFEPVRQDQLTRIISGAWATMLTGGGLLFCALCAGCGFYVVVEIVRPRHSRSIHGQQLEQIK